MRSQENYAQGRLKLDGLHYSRDFTEGKRQYWQGHKFNAKHMATLMLVGIMIRLPIILHRFGKSQVLKRDARLFCIMLMLEVFNKVLVNRAYI